MKQLGNLAMVCAHHPNVLMQICNGEVSVDVLMGAKRDTLLTSWNNDEEISRIIHELNFGCYAVRNTGKEDGPGKCKEKALEIVDRMRRENYIRSGDYAVLCDSLSGMESSQDRDEILTMLWEQFEDVPMNPVTECMEAPFLSWGTSTHREEIWQWFDKRHSKGVAYLMYGNRISEPNAERLAFLKQFCIKCIASTCRYIHDGTCRFALLRERPPHMDAEAGCTDFQADS